MKKIVFAAKKGPVLATKSNDCGKGCGKGGGCGGGGGGGGGNACTNC